jgi:hypothetical protein
MGREKVAKGNITKLYYSDYINSEIKPGNNMQRIEINFKKDESMGNKIESKNIQEKPKVTNLKNIETELHNLKTIEEDENEQHPSPTIKSKRNATKDTNIVVPEDIKLEPSEPEQNKMQEDRYNEFVVGKIGKWQTPTPKKEDPENDIRETPKKSSAALDENQIQVTLRDLAAYSPSYTLSNNIDTRMVCKYLFDYFAEKTFFSLFLKTSILIPFWVRYNHCLLFISILSVTNAMIFLDEYIEKRVSLPQPIRVFKFIIIG